MPIRTVPELASLRDRARRLLAVFPHPDDEAYGCAGAFARAANDPDTAAVLLCLTRGEASKMGPERGLSPAEVGALREKRLEEVARIVELDGLIVGTLPDSGLARCGLDEVAAVVRAAVSALRPQVVIGHDPRGVNAHPDHIATHWAIRHALLDEPGIRFAMLAYLPEVAEAVKPRLLFPTPEDEIDAVIELTDEETLRKETCLRVHEALITLVDENDEQLIRRPPVERYDFLGERMPAPVDDLFDSLPEGRGDALRDAPLVVRRGPYALAAWAPGTALPDFEFAMHDDRETTALVRETELDGLPPPRAVERGWALVTLDTVLAWDVVGVLASLTRALADAGVPLGAFSAFSRDHLLVPAARLDDALAALANVCGPARHEP